MVDFKSPVNAPPLKGVRIFWFTFCIRIMAIPSQIMGGGIWGVPVDSHEFFLLEGTKNPSGSWKNMKKTDRKSRLKWAKKKQMGHLNCQFFLLQITIMFFDSTEYGILGTDGKNRPNQKRLLSFGLTLLLWAHRESYYFEAKPRWRFQIFFMFIPKRWGFLLQFDSDTYFSKCPKNPDPSKVAILRT